MPKYESIDDYFGSFPEDVALKLSALRDAIKGAAPGAEETFKYGIPTFTLNGNLVHFAGFKTHIGFYPTPSGVEKFKKELASYNVAKGSIQFPLDKPLPISLIKKIVKFRVKENMGWAKKC